MYQPAHIPYSADMVQTRSEVLSTAPPMFSSRLLNGLTRTHPLVPLVLYGPVILVLAAVGVSRIGVLLAIALMVAGYLTWTLTEYWVHRAVFHFQPRGPRTESFVWAIHGVHHDHPNDPRRIVALPVVSIPIGAAAAALFWLVLPGATWLPFAAGWGGGYLVYDLLHAYLHLGRPRSALIRWLRARHLRHHFADPRGDFGVSAPYWDHVFGTALPPRQLSRRADRKRMARYC
jgi:sterol desaturase/sphingolipid hydroxylase (fatty acid hydroxylase superfamily)